MSSRREALLRAAALAVTGLSGGLALIGAVYGLLNLETAAALGTTAFEPSYTTSLIMTVVGLLIAWRHPGHLLAWTFLAIGLSGEMLGAVRNYGFYGTVTDPGSLPGADILSWIALWGFVIPASGTFFALLLFPNGRLIGRRWYLVVLLILAAMGLIGAAYALGREPRSVIPFGSPLAAQELEGLVRIGGVLLSVGVLVWERRSSCDIVRRRPRSDCSSSGSCTRAAQWSS